MKDDEQQRAYREHRAKRARQRRAAPSEEWCEVPPAKDGITRLERQRDAEIAALERQYRKRRNAAYRAWYLAGKPNRLKPDEQADEFNTDLFHDPFKGVYIHKTTKMSRNEHRKKVRELCIAKQAAALVPSMRTQFGKEVDAIYARYAELIQAYRQTPAYRTDLLRDLVEKAIVQIELHHVALHEPYRLHLPDDWADQEPGRRAKLEAILQENLNVVLSYLDGEGVRLLREAHGPELKDTGAAAVYEEPEPFEDWVQRMEKFSSIQPDPQEKHILYTLSHLTDSHPHVAAIARRRRERWEALAKNQAKPRPRRKVKPPFEYDPAPSVPATHLRSVEDGLKWQRIEAIDQLLKAERETLSFPEFADLMEEKWGLEEAWDEERQLPTPAQFRRWQRGTL